MHEQVLKFFRVTYVYQRRRTGVSTRSFLYTVEVEKRSSRNDVDALREMCVGNHCAITASVGNSTLHNTGSAKRNQESRNYKEISSLENLQKEYPCE